MTKFIELPISAKNKDLALTAICYGNSTAAKVLDYYIYGANQEAEKKNIDKSCDTITLIRSQQDIMKKLSCDISQRSLIRYNRLFTEWGYVKLQKYSKEYIICRNTIVAALENPPEKPKKVAKLREKSCQVVNFSKNVDRDKKLTTWQQKVDNLATNVDNLATNVDNLSTFQLGLSPLPEPAEGVKIGPPSIYSNYSNITVDSSALAENPIIKDLFDLIRQQSQQIADLQSQVDELRKEHDANITPLASSPRSSGPPISILGDSGTNLPNVVQTTFTSVPPKRNKKMDEKSLMKSRVKDFCEAFKALSIEKFEVAEFNVRTPSIKEELYEEICSLIDAGASQESMRLVFLELWNEKNEASGYWWRDPTHLTLRALCKNFNARLASARFKLKKEEKFKLKKEEKEEEKKAISQSGEPDFRKMSLKEQMAYKRQKYGMPENKLAVIR